jgi:hypothetical protein
MAAWLQLPDGIPDAGPDGVSDAAADQAAHSDSDRVRLAIVLRQGHKRGACLSTCAPGCEWARSSTSGSGRALGLPFALYAASRLDTVTSGRAPAPDAIRPVSADARQSIGNCNSGKLPIHCPIHSTSLILLTYSMPCGARRNPTLLPTLAPTPSPTRPPTADPTETPTFMPTVLPRVVRVILA